jgi:hypothetical protein
VIRYTLACAAGHSFESWFPDSAAGEQQLARHLVTCPECGSTEVEKAIMAPSIGRAGREPAPPPAAVAPSPAPESAAQPVALLSERERELRRMLKELRDHVKQNADYVGEQFPELARQMHNDEIDRRSIYGEAKPQEVKELLDEGIEVQPLPILPDERN